MSSSRLDVLYVLVIVGWKVTAPAGSAQTSDTTLGSMVRLPDQRCTRCQLSLAAELLDNMPAVQSWSASDQLSLLKTENVGSPHLASCTLHELPQLTCNVSSQASQALLAGATHAHKECTGAVKGKDARQAHEMRERVLEQHQLCAPGHLAALNVGLLQGLHTLPVCVQRPFNESGDSHRLSWGGA